MESLETAIAQSAYPLRQSPDDLTPLLDLVGDSRLVLLGEATHGTHEFYRERARITKRLIVEKGFSAIAVEGDWPDCYRVNRYIAGYGRDREAIDALADFRRFPAWMWRNADVLDLVGWLRSHCDRLGDRPKVGFYGLDVYSMHSSMQAVLEYLDKVDPQAAKRARYRFSCFDQFGEDPQTYGHAAAFDLEAGCREEVVQQLSELRRRQSDLISRDGLLADDDWFEAEQNARVVVGAEAYYRTMFEGRVSSWNLRDTHMADTLDALLRHLDRRSGRSKIVVWAHNSHVGDARATEMGRAGELNLGQLARERHAGDAVLVGFTTHAGSVTAASDWGEPAERMRVRPSLAGSYERLFHDAGVPAFYLDLRDLGEAAGALAESRLHRAIGVVYRPDTERGSHYFSVTLPEQFDAVFHLDETRALEPLERTAGWMRGEAPETYPTGF